MNRRTPSKRRNVSIRSRLCLVAIMLALSGCTPAGAGSTAQSVQEITTPSGVAMAILPGGTFAMGSSAGSDDESPRRQVTLAPFAIDRHEQTQDLYAVLEEPNPSHFKGPRRPVEQVRWSEAAIFCNIRSEQDGLQPCYDEATFACDFSADGYRLPTEAEWEYAARAGSDADYHFGGSPSTLPRYACYAGNSKKRTEPVGSKKPNAFGLHDMLGNVAEWCNDVYEAEYYAAGASDNPRGPAQGKYRVLRGGSWKSSDDACRVAARGADEPGISDACFAKDTYGFRCVRRLSDTELAALAAKNSPAGANATTAAALEETLP